MACSTNTYPINLANTSNNCDITCNLSFDYNNSTNFKVENKNGSYLLIEYERSSNPNVTLSSTKYTASELRLYVPSIHTYDGKRANAELLINHNGNNNKHLIISVPIVNKGFVSNSGNDLAKIVQDMASKRLNNFIDPLTITNYSLNLNDIVPEKPFFFYEGCNNSTNLFTNTNVKIIAFNNTSDSNSSGAIYVDDNFIKNLTALLTIPNNISTVKASKYELFYNANGPSNSKKDNIYIDCQPTNEEGEIYVSDETSKPPDFFGGLSNIIQNKKDITIFKGLFGLFIMFVILWVAKIILDAILSKLKGQNSNNSLSLLST